MFVGGLSVGVGSSPHTRGALAAGSAEACPERIIPAYAGSTIPTPTGSCSRADHPRIRGEHRILPAGQTLPGGSSPHTRGAPDHAERSLHCPGIIPAYAGSTHIDSRFFQLKRDHPRIRGEHRAPLPTPACAHGSSPHTRGAPARPFNRLGGCGIIPAYAGSTTTPPAQPAPCWDHPRIRGEHFLGQGQTPAGPGSSPHTRGARGWRWRWPGRPGDHPRIRGEHGTVLTRLLGRDGSSPHTRGARQQPGPGGLPPGIIPAYAGSTFLAGGRRSAPSDHPRIRGEHLPPLDTAWGRLGSSPHTRGAPPASGPGPAAVRIIPAYAGSTDRAGLPEGVGPDHPRIRGEHWRVIRTGVCARGSSPHTRGAHARLPADFPLRRIIPAYAGSTLYRYGPYKGT